VVEYEEEDKRRTSEKKKEEEEMESSSSGRTASEAELQGSPTSSLEGDGQRTRVPPRPTRDRFVAELHRRAKDYDVFLEVEEYKKAVMSAIQGGGFGQERNVDRRWPELLSGSTGCSRSLAEVLREGVDEDGSKKGDDVSLPMMFEEQEEIIENVRELPLPSIEGVPEDVVERVYTKDKGKWRHQVMCEHCANCVRSLNHQAKKDEQAGNASNRKRRKTDGNYPCLTVQAVKEYENEMGYLGGADLVAVVQKIRGQPGVPSGRGVRCRKCRQCLGYQNEGKRANMCFVAAAVRDDRLPERFAPVLKAAIEEDIRLLSYPYIKQLAVMRRTGLDCLRERREGGNLDIGSEDDEEEAYRWGETNVPWGTRWRIVDHANRFGDKRRYSWTCLDMIRGNGSLCGKSHKFLSKACVSCKAQRWLGPGGQLEVRVAEILDRDCRKGLDGAPSSHLLREIIGREFGDPAMLHEDCLTSEAIDMAVRAYRERQNEIQEGAQKLHIDPPAISAPQDEDVLLTGQQLKWSSFGRAIAQYEEVLFDTIRRRQSTNFGDDLFEPAMPTASMNSLALSRHSMNESIAPRGRVVVLDSFADGVINDIEYIIRCTRGPPHSSTRDKCSTLKSYIMDWGREMDWLGALQRSWSCPRLRLQMATIVSGCYMFTIKSFLAHCIHKIQEQQGTTSDVRGADESVCQVCGIDHSMPLPPWRTHPGLVKWNDMVHDATPRVLDDTDFTVISNDTNNASRLVAETFRACRYPLYRLIEGTLNETAARLAVEKIPVKYRGVCVNGRLPRSYTDVSRFPHLPTDALQWYDQQVRGATVDPDVAVCTPSKDPRSITDVILPRIQRAALSRVKRANKMACKITSNGRRTDSESGAGRPLTETVALSPDSVFQPYDDDELGEPDEERHQEDHHDDSIEQLIQDCPTDVQNVFRASSSLMDPSVVRESIRRYLSATNML
jgi:hypothetical protein